METKIVIASPEKLLLPAEPVVENSGLLVACSKACQAAYSALDQIVRSIATNASSPCMALLRFKRVTCGMFDEEFAQYAVDYNVPAKNIFNIDQTILNFPLSPSIHSRLIVSSTEQEEDFLAACWLLQMIHEKIAEPELRQRVTSEVLAKVIAYRDLSPGREVPVPCLDNEGKPIRVMYRVEQRFNLWMDIPAYGLVAQEGSNQPPILLFRGTSLALSARGGPASFSACFDEEGSGRTAFFNNQSELDQWLAQVTSKGLKAHVVGNGLGGTFGAYSAIYLGQYINMIHSFNPLGVTEEMSKQWQGISESKRPQLQHFITRGDIVSKFGYLFGDAYELTLDHVPNSVSAHLTMMLLQPHCAMRPINIAQENQSKSRKICHDWQYHYQSLFHRIIKGIILGPLYLISKITSNRSNESCLSSGFKIVHFARAII